MDYVPWILPQPSVFPINPLLSFTVTAGTKMFCNLWYIWQSSHSIDKCVCGGGWGVDGQWKAKALSLHSFFWLIFSLSFHPEHLFLTLINWVLTLLIKRPQEFGWNIPGHGTIWEAGQPFNRTLPSSVFFPAFLFVAFLSLHLQSLAFPIPLHTPLLCMDFIQTYSDLQGCLQSYPSSWLNSQDLYCSARYWEESTPI